MVLVRQLLKAGADPNYEDNGLRRPLHHVLYPVDGIEGDTAGVTRALVKAGADLNAKDRGGHSVLALAEGRRRADLVALFRSLEAKK